MLQYTLIGDDMTRLREWAQSTTLPDAAKDPGAAIVARDLALAWCLLYSASQSAADRTAAVEAMRRAAKLMSGYGPGLRQLADAAFVIEEFDLAAQLYTTSAKLLGDSDSVIGDPIVHTSYGPRSTLEVVANWFNPADVLRALIGNQPVRRTIRRRTGVDLAQACKELDKAKKRNRWQDWYRASTLLEDAQDYSNALIHARRATSVAETAEAWNWKGVLLSKMGSKQHFDEQLEAYEKACALAPSDGVMLSNLARTLWEGKRYDDACAVYERVKRARLPRDSEDIKYATMTVLGWKEAGNSPEKCEVAALHFVLDDTGHLASDATVPVASEVARIAAKDGRPWAHWCLYRLTGDRSHLDAAIAANPEEPLFCAERMEDLLADGDLDGALTWAAKAQELRRNRAPLPRGLDRAARKMLDEVYRQRLLDLADGMQNYVKLLKRQRRADADAPSVPLPQTGT
jgi:tetratricopeptide (TPR) repeat protein